MAAREEGGPVIKLCQHWRPKLSNRPDALSSRHFKRCSSSYASWRSAQSSREGSTGEVAGPRYWIVLSDSQKVNQSLSRLLLRNPTEPDMTTASKITTQAFLTSEVIRRIEVPPHGGVDSGSESAPIARPLGGMDSLLDCYGPPMRPQPHRCEGRTRLSEPRPLYHGGI